MAKPDYHRGVPKGCSRACVCGHDPRMFCRTCREHNCPGDPTRWRPASAVVWEAVRTQASSRSEQLGGLFWRIYQSGRQKVSETIRTLKDLEKAEITKALKLLGHDRKPEIAKALGISLKTLYNKLHQYGLGLRGDK